MLGALLALVLLAVLFVNILVVLLKGVLLHRHTVNGRLVAWLRHLVLHLRMLINLVSLLDRSFVGASLKLLVHHLLALVVHLVWLGSVLSFLRFFCL